MGEDMEPIIEIVAIVSTVLLFPLGVWVGYRWRDRISQRRRVQYLAERLREKREALEREKSSIGDSTEVADRTGH